MASGLNAWTKDARSLGIRGKSPHDRSLEIMGEYPRNELEIMVSWWEMMLYWWETHPLLWPQPFRLLNYFNLPSIGDDSGVFIVLSYVSWWYEKKWSETLIKRCSFHHLKPKNKHRHGIAKGRWPWRRSKVAWLCAGDTHLRIQPLGWIQIQLLLGVTFKKCSVLARELHR